LHYEDRNSMAFSIEARVPFLDESPLCAAVMNGPSRMLHHGRTKVVLREATAGRVPDLIRERTDKIGFAAPTERWLAGPMRAWWQDLCRSRSFAERGCFDVKGVERLIARFDAGDPSAALPLWRTAIVEQWARRMIDTPSA